MIEKVGNAACIVVGAALGAAVAVYSVALYARGRGLQNSFHGAHR